MLSVAAQYAIKPLNFINSHAFSAWLKSEEKEASYDSV
jgi:hypothetical protein